MQNKLTFFFENLVPRYERPSPWPWYPLPLISHSVTDSSTPSFPLTADVVYGRPPIGNLPIGNLINQNQQIANLWIFFVENWPSS